MPLRERESEGVFDTEGEGTEGKGAFKRERVRVSLIQKVRVLYVG